MPEREVTQAVSEATTDMDRLTTGEAVTLIGAEEATVAVALASQRDALRRTRARGQRPLTLDIDG
jgi:N-acetylmuramic acid 6-phosphate (MurNAc-6-P) etherase